MNAQAATSQFFAILSLLCWTGTVIVLVLAWVRHVRPDSGLAYLFDDIAARAVWFAFVIALVTTMGSLYLSEVDHFVPCPLCWYQRICMYPLVIALLVGGVRRDPKVWTYVLPPALIGAGVAIYHTQLQAFPKQHGPFCSLTDPCITRYVWEFGFVSIPFMALSAFSFIIVMMLIVRYLDRSPDNSFDPADASELDDALSLTS